MLNEEIFYGVAFVTINMLNYIENSVSQINGVRVVTREYACIYSCYNDLESDLKKRINPNSSLIKKGQPLVAYLFAAHSKKSFVELSCAIPDLISEEQFCSKKFRKNKQAIKSANDRQIIVTLDGRTYKRLCYLAKVDSGINHFGSRSTNNRTIINIINKTYEDGVPLYLRDADPTKRTELEKGLAKNLSPALLDLAKAINETKGK